MTGLFRYKYIILLFLAGATPSCTPDPSIEMIENYRFSLDGESGNKMLAGEVTDVLFRAQNTIDPLNNQVRVLFDVLSGGGSVSQSSVVTDSTGYVTISWQLGNDSFDQKLAASVYKLSGKYLASANLIAHAFMENEWNVISGMPDGYITDMVADTVSRMTFMIASGSLYRQGSRYFLWEKVSDDNLESPRSVDIDNNRVIYVSLWDGNIVKSTDHGESWKKCTKPYPEDPYYIYMSVSNDNYIWVAKWNFPTRFSKDGGITWQDAEELSTFLNGNTFRLKNGILVNHGTNGISRFRFNISYDDGLTWEASETPGYSTGIYVTENDEIFIINQDYGFSIYRTTDLGLTYSRVYSAYPPWTTTTENNNFTRWNDFYYVIVPGYGILKSSDLIHYEDYWRSSDIRDLFVDHNGVLIAKGQDFRTVYYRKVTE